MSESYTASIEPNPIREDLIILSQRTGKRWLLFLYDILIKLRPLTEEPEEKELRHDLYVMF